MINWIFLYVENNKIEFYFNLIVVVVGFATNVFSIFIFMRKSLNNKTNVGYLHSILCVFNLCTLTNSIFLTEILPYFDIHIIDSSELCCKLFSFWRRFTIGLSSFQQLYITFILFITVKFPSKYMIFNDKKKSILFMALIIFSLFIINIPFLFFELNRSLELNETYLDGLKMHSCCASIDLTTFSIISNILMRYFIPLFLMLVLNLCIKRHFKVKQLLFNSNFKNKPTNFLLSIFILNALFCLLHLPWTIINLILVFLNFFYNENKIITDNGYLTVFLTGISLSVSYVNYTTPFFVHFIFNKYFKNEVLNLFRKKMLMSRLSSSKTRSMKL